MKKLLSLALCLSLFLGLCPAGTVFANENWPDNVSVSADGGILMDADSGAILYDKNMHEEYYPASITKVLTALVILENCGLDDMVTFSHSAVNTLESNATILGARVGDQLSVRECLYALLLQSANEVANALAEHCSGSIEAFAELMNRKAKALGCLNSNFVNPSGLNDENHYTSAYDMALIAKAAFDNPAFVEIDSALYYDVQPGQLQQYPDGWRYYAHHQMMKKNNSAYYEGIIGGKTGYTSLAGNTLITCAERDGMRLITVILNGHQTHYTDTKALLDFGFDNFRSIAIADQDSTYQKIENDLTISGVYAGTFTRLSINSGSVITLPVNGDFSEVTSSLNYSLDQTAPEAAVARIDYMYGSRKVGQAYLEASTIEAYVPDSAPVLESAGSGEVTTLEVAGRTLEEIEVQGSREAAETTAAPEADTGTPETTGASVLPVVIRVVSVIAVLGIIGGTVFGILAWRERKEQNEQLLRRQRREKRLKEWGYSTTEFDQIMQEHLRSKNQFKKRSFRDRFRRH